MPVVSSLAPKRGSRVRIYVPRRLSALVNVCGKAVIDASDKTSAPGHRKVDDSVVSGSCHSVRPLGIEIVMSNY